MTDQQIVEKLNQDGMKTNRGNSFTLSILLWIRHQHGIPAYNTRRPGELSVNEAAEKFKVSPHVIRYWAMHDIIKTRSAPNTRLWIIAIEPEKEIELKNRANNSTKIADYRKKQQDPETQL